MNTNVNFAAPLGVLAFLGTGFILLGCSLFLAYSLVVKKFGRAKLVLGGIATNRQGCSCKQVVSDVAAQRVLT